MCPSSRLLYSSDTGVRRLSIVGVTATHNKTPASQVLWCFIALATGLGTSFERDKLSILALQLCLRMVRTVTGSAPQNCSANRQVNHDGGCRFTHKLQGCFMGVPRGGYLCKPIREMHLPNSTTGAASVRNRAQASNHLRDAARLQLYGRIGTSLFACPMTQMLLGK